MQLTDVQKLTKDYTKNDVTEIGAVMASTTSSSPAAVLRFKDVKPSDVQTYMKNVCASSLKGEFTIKRMSTMEGLASIPSTPYAEHLVIRDLDMEHIETSEDRDVQGRVVAHADWRFTPSFHREADEPDGGINSTNESSEMPEGFNKELHILLNSSIVSSVEKLFGGLPFFSLYGISTLTPSHLRKGIAKRLVEWAYPLADHFALPVVLYASPAGLHLYRNCGFEEYRDHDIKIDLDKWGREDVHRHVVMLRWPKDDKRLSDSWQQWRKDHKEGRPAQDS